MVNNGGTCNLRKWTELSIKLYHIDEKACNDCIDNILYYKKWVNQFYKTGDLADN